MLKESTANAENQRPGYTSLQLPSLSVKFFIYCLILALLKLWLIHGDEIVARDYPFDDPWYIISAKQWYWLGSYNISSLSRLPAYPLWIAFANLTGIPLRISIELLLLTAAFAFVASLIKAGQPCILCLLLYVAIIFHPLSFYVNNYMHADAFYAPILLLSLACLILLLLKRDNPHQLWYALMAGLAFAVLWHTRHENIDLVCDLVIYALIMLFTIGGQRKAWPATLKQVGIIILVLAAVIWGASLTVNTLNFVQFGIFAATDMTAPGFAAAHKALLRIKPASPRRFVPVPQEVRKQAYAVSPAFRELEAYFEGEFGKIWAKATPPEMDAQGEIGSGWFAWALHGAGTLAVHPKSAGEADAYFQRVANEINAACDDGRLPSRWAFSSFLDPHVQNYLPYLPSSFLRLARLFTSLGEAPKERDNPLEIRNEMLALFDAIANRRGALTHYGIVNISGWAVHVKDPLQKIVVRNQNNQIVTSTDQFSPRPDVAASLTAKGVIPLNTGYHLSIPLMPSERLSGDVIFITQGGTEFVIPDKTIALRGPAELFSVNSQEPLTYNIEAAETFKPSHKLENSIQSFIWSVYRPIVIILTYVGLGSVLMMLIFYQLLDLKKAIYAILALLTSVIAARVVLFTLFDAAIAPCQQRYLFPLMSLYTCILLILISQAINVVKSRLKFNPVVRRIHFRKTFEATD